MTPLSPEPGRVALVRQRRYLVEKVVPPPSSGEAMLVDLSCLDDDAQGEPLSVLWEHELEARVLEDDGWSAVADKGFDDPALFAAYLRTLSWNCVTATDPNLFQAPFRAGIRIDAYQLDPLRKVAEAGRYDADARVRRIVEWIDANMCPLYAASKAPPPPDTTSVDRRSPAYLHRVRGHAPLASAQPERGDRALRPATRVDRGLHGHDLPAAAGRRQARL